MRCFVWLVVLGVSTVVIGCGPRESDAQKLKRLMPNAQATTKVTGNVTVDGDPNKDIWVTLHPVDPNVKERPRAQTNDAGDFEIGTYLAKDGAPPGDYTITIEWLEFIKREKDWGGPDQLKNQYNDPKTTPFKVTVGDEPVELPPFELQLQGVTGKPDPKPPAGRREK